MTRGNLYKNLAWCYEFITTGEGHKKEADFVKGIVRKYKKSKGNKLLDVHKTPGLKSVKFFM